MAGVFGTTQTLQCTRFCFAAVPCVLLALSREDRHGYGIMLDARQTVTATIWGRPVPKSIELLFGLHRI